MTLAGRELIKKGTDFPGCLLLLGSVAWSAQSVGFKNAQLQPHIPSGHQRQLHEPVGLTTGGRSAATSGLYPDPFQITRELAHCRPVCPRASPQLVGKDFVRGAPGLFWDTSTAMCFL